LLRMRGRPLGGRRRDGGGRMNQDERVRPYTLRTGDQFAVATVDGIAALVVCVSEEAARGFADASRVEGVAPHAVTVEEIVETCGACGLACAGLYGFEEDMSMSVISVEVVALVLTEGP
jgi:hypothetical protein